MNSKYVWLAAGLALGYLVLPKVLTKLNIGG